MLSALPTNTNNNNEIAATSVDNGGEPPHLALLPVDLDAEEAVGERVDDDMRKVEGGRERLPVEVALVLRPDNVHNVVADVLLLRARESVCAIRRHVIWLTRQ